MLILADFDNFHCMTCGFYTHLTDVYVVQKLYLLSSTAYQIPQWLVSGQLISCVYTDYIHTLAMLIIG